jgi:hypothetical protein
MNEWKKYDKRVAIKRCWISTSKKKNNVVVVYNKKQEEEEEESVLYSVL